MRKKDLLNQLQQTQKALEEANRRLLQAYPEKERYKHITGLMCSHVILSEMLYDYDAMIALTVKEHPKSETIRAAYDRFCDTVPHHISMLQTLAEEYRLAFHAIKRDDLIVGEMLEQYNSFFRAVNGVNDAINRLVTANLGTLHRDIQSARPGLPLPDIKPAPIRPTQSPVPVPASTQKEKPQYPPMSAHDAMKDAWSAVKPVVFILLIIVILIIVFRS